MSSEKCTATSKRTGKRCGLYPVRGASVCKWHGGGAPAVKAAGERRAQEEAARKQLSALGEPQAIDPADALLKLISWKHGEVIWLRAQVQDLPDDQLAWSKASHEHGVGPEGPIDRTTDKAAPSVWWALLRQAEDQLADYATRALKAGIAERQVRLAEAEGQMVYAVLLAVFERLALTPEQWEVARMAAPQELRRLSGE